MRQLVLRDIVRDGDVVQTIGGGTTTVSLNGPEGLVIVQIGGLTFVYIGDFEDNSLDVYRLEDDGTLTFVQEIDDTAALQLSQVNSLTSTEIGGTNYVFTSGYNGEGISVFEVDPATGTLTNRGNFSDASGSSDFDTDGTNDFNRAEGVKIAEVDGNQFLIASSDLSDRVGAYQITQNADNSINLTRTDVRVDNGTLELNGAQEVEIVTTSQGTFVYVAAQDDFGVQGFELTSTGQLEFINGSAANGRLRDQADADNLNLRGVEGLASVETAGGNRFLFTAAGFDASASQSTRDDGVSVFRINEDGTLVNTDNVADDATLLLNGATAVTAFNFKGESYVIVGSEIDDGIEVFTVDELGQLTQVQSISNVGGSGDVPETNSVEGVRVEFIDGRPFIVATSDIGDAINSFALVCFAGGTRIQTPTGPRPVEELCSGDLVETLDNGPRPVRWIGRRQVSAAELRANPHWRPVVVQPGALGPDCPARPLRVSPQHHLLVRGRQLQLMFGDMEMLVPARALVDANRARIDTDTAPVTYYHLQLDAHEILLAEGAPAESLLNGALAEGFEFDNPDGQVVALRPRPARAMLSMQEGRLAALSA